MTVDFNILKRNELRAAVRLVGRAFEDYEYFTNYFPDLEERRKVLGGVVHREYLTNFKRTHYLVVKAASKREQSDACINSAEREQARPEVKKNGELVAVVQVNAPDYKKPSDFQYLIHGWPLVYLGVNRQRLDDWMRSWSVKKILLTTKIESYNVTKDNETIMDDSRHPDAMRRNRDDLLLQGRRR